MSLRNLYWNVKMTTAFLCVFLSAVCMNYETRNDEGPLTTKKFREITEVAMDTCVQKVIELQDALKEFMETIPRHKKGYSRNPNQTIDSKETMKQFDKIRNDFFDLVRNHNFFSLETLLGVRKTGCEAIYRALCNREVANPEITVREIYARMFDENIRKIKYVFKKTLCALVFIQDLQARALAEMANGKQKEHHREVWLRKLLVFVEQRTNNLTKVAEYVVKHQTMHISMFTYGLCTVVQMMDITVYGYSGTGFFSEKSQPMDFLKFLSFKTSPGAQNEEEDFGAHLLQGIGKRDSTSRL